MDSVVDRTTQHMLTTVDNPFDPFTQFDAWLVYDTACGYYTPGYLDRIVIVSDELSEADQALAIESGIDEIIDLNINGLYRKVSRSVTVSN